MFCIIEFNIIRLLVNSMLIILFIVIHDMLLKIASLTKHLATYIAYIWFITSVMSLFSINAVSLNIPLLIKQNSYYLTKRKSRNPRKKSHYPREKSHCPREKSHCPRGKSLSTLKKSRSSAENLTIMKSGKSQNKRIRNENRYSKMIYFDFKF